MPDMSPTFPAVVLPHLEGVELPKLRRVRVRQPETPMVPDTAAAVRAALDAQAGLFEGLAEGAEIAVAVGSRGICEIDLVARTAVEWLKARGLAPFIVPGMGSHGGGTAEGQRAVLARLGVDEARMGCEIRATMETVQYGEIEGGHVCHFDANAAAAAGVLAINRVKAHTSYPRPVESGLTKMLAVGLGKQQGARSVHFTGPRGLSEVLPRLAARVVERAPLTAGLALVENAEERIAHVEAVPPAEFYAADERLLKMSKAAMARLPFDLLDGLIVEKVGKDISGAGMDPAICGRADIRGVENPKTPYIHKIAVLGMTEATGGNGMGVGVADYAPRACIEALDLKAIYMNAVTATIIEKARLPVVLPDDRAVLRALVATCWAAGAPRICQIKSTLHLDEMAVTDNLAEELREKGLLLSEDAPAPLTFDAEGRLNERLWQ